MLPAIGTSTLVYIVVAIAAMMLVDPGELIGRKEVALALAGEEALGTIGLLLITMAALFSTASAINATLFATANLSVLVAKEKQLPDWFAHRDNEGVPRRALVTIAVLGALFAVLGSIEQIVTFASLTFLIVFAVVNALEAKDAKKRGASLMAAAGAIALLLALLVVVVWLATNRQGFLVAGGAVALCLGSARWVFMRHSG